MRDLEGDLGLASRPPGDSPVDRQPELCGVRSLDPLKAAFDSDVVAWLAWLEQARAVWADEHAMRRLEFVYAAGWTAVVAAVVTIPLVGAAAAVLGVVLLVGTLALGCAVTVTDWHDVASGAVDDTCTKCSSVGPVERARLVRIINLSRVAARPLGAKLLLGELDEALASEPFANWVALTELRDIVQDGCVQLVPFGTDAPQRQSAYLFAGHVP